MQNTLESRKNFRLHIIFATLIFCHIVTVDNSLAEPITSLDARENSLPQKPATEELSTNSQPEFNSSSSNNDFLANNSPLSKPTTPIAVKQEKIDIPQTEGSSALFLEKNGKDCTASGNADQGEQVCLERRDNGSFLEETQVWENTGDEVKVQTTMWLYDQNANIVERSTIRKKTEYLRNDAGNKIMEREFYDVLKQPTEALTSRNLIVKQFNADGELSKLSWAHYREIGPRKAALVHHAVLQYEKGKLFSALIDRYDEGKITKNLLNYSAAKTPELNIEKTGLLKWAGYIEQLIGEPQATAF